MIEFNRRDLFKRQAPSFVVRDGLDIDFFARFDEVRHIFVDACFIRGGDDAAQFRPFASPLSAEGL